MEFSF